MISMVFNRVLKNKYQAVSQGDYRLEAQRLEHREAKKRQKRLCFKLPSLLSWDIQRISKSRTTPDHSLRRCFSTPC